MALDAIKGADALDALADIIEPVFSIAEDEAVKKALAGMNGENAAAKLRKAAPVILKNHKAEVIQIIAATQGKEVAEVEAEMNILTLPMWLVQVFSDPAVTGFLASALQEV